ncbi:MAG: GH39 family glycosyl hydrolase [Janthinobacterium lividum]
MQVSRFALLALLPSLIGSAQQPATTNQVTVRVDLAGPREAYQPVYNWFGYDEGNYTTAPHGRELLRELHDLSPVPVYIRAHHLLTSGDGKPELKWSSTGVYHEDSNGNPVYDFTILDGIFDAYKAAGVRPMVELGFMPKDLAATLPNRHEPYQVHFPKSTISGASNNPPKDYAKWRDLTRTVVAHLVERYGADTVRQWPIEVWNEPDIDYWHDTPEAYWRLYDFAVAGVRAALPDAMVGGPASTSPRNDHARKFLEDFLTHVDNGKSAATGGKVPLSFISFHVKGQPTIVGGDVTMGLQEELTDADRGFATIASHHSLAKLPIILSEADPEGCAACSSKTNPANNYRNGTLYPAYTAAAYKGLLALAAKHQVNLLSMLSWSFEFEDSDYFEGFRDLATNGVDKPILNLFRMLGLMQGAQVPATSTGAVPLETLLEKGIRTGTDADAFATADAHSGSVLLWNYADPAASTQSAAMNVQVAGIPLAAHRALVTQYRIDNTHSNAYTAWQAMGSPQRPSAAQVATLKEKGSLELLRSPMWRDVENGQIHLEVNLPAESIALVQVNW